MDDAQQILNKEAQYHSMPFVSFTLLGIILKERRIFRQCFVSCERINVPLMPKKLRSRFKGGNIIIVEKLKEKGGMLKFGIMPCIKD